MRIARRLGLACLVALLAASTVHAEDLDLVIEVGPDVVEHGGVMTVYPMPIDQRQWDKLSAKEATPVVRLDERYGVVQFRYLRDRKYKFRVRPIEGSENREAYVSQVLSIIGTDGEGRGPQMEAGFTGDYSSGGQTIRSLPRNEYAGTDEATRSKARWGRTEAIDEPPPADQRGARSLLGVVEYGVRDFPLTCTGSDRAQVCTISPERRSEIDALWWRSIAEARLERLQFHALRRCYDSTWSGGGKCDDDPDSDEPEFIHRP